MDADEMRAEARKCFDMESMPPLSTWLLKEMPLHGEERLKAVGNIVIRKVATLATHVLGQMESSA